MVAKEFRGLIAHLAQAGTPTAPRCPHAEECGGCAFQGRTYSDQVAAKAAALTKLWEGHGPQPSVEVVASPDPFNYRTRMDYVATKGRFGLRRRGRFNHIVELETCHLIPPAAFAPAHAVWLRSRALGLPDYDMRSHLGFLRYVVVRRSPTDEVLIAIVTAEGPHEAEVEQLAALALSQPGVVSFHWLMNDTLTDVSFGTPRRHWGAATLPMVVGRTTLQIGPNTFFQNNVHLLLPLLDATANAVGEVDRLADLYGGVGTIALHLAGQAGEVVTVEAVAESAALARENIAAAGAANVRAVAADVLPFLRDQPPGAFDVVVADPPRVGLGPDVCAELLRLAPRRIVYVSCNPLTQRDDVAALAPRYRLDSLLGYDMFPHTPHVEALGVLERRGAPML